MVLINVMRGGPGLGSIGPSQADYFQATKGHGHGDYRVPVLAPSSIAEAVELVADAFALAERYRTPVMILADGVLGQAMEPVVPIHRRLPRTPGGWDVAGADGRAPRVVRSLHLRPEDLEAHNRHLQAKFAAIAEREVRWVGEHLDDAEIAIVAYGTSARVARTADRAGPRARSASRPVPSHQPLAVPGAGSHGHRVEASSHRRRGDVGRAADRGRPLGGRGSNPGLLAWPNGRDGPDPRRRGRCGAAGLGIDAGTGPMCHDNADARPATPHLPTTGTAGRSADALLPGLRSRNHPPSRRRAAGRAAPWPEGDRGRWGRMRCVRLRLPCGRLCRGTARPRSGRRHRRPTRPSRCVRVHLPGRRRPGRDRDGRDHPRRSAG